MARAKKAVPKLPKRKLSEIKADYLAAIRGIQQYERELKTYYPDKDMDIDWKDEIEVDVKYIYVSNEFPSIDKQNEQWVGLQFETPGGIKFDFNFHDLEDIQYLVDNIIDMRDFVEDQNENWTPDEDKSEEDVIDMDLQQIIDQLQSDLDGDKETKKKNKK